MVWYHMMHPDPFILPGSDMHALVSAGLLCAKAFDNCLGSWLP